MIGNETVYIKTWNTKRLTGPSVKMLNYYLIYIQLNWINISEINWEPMKLSDSHNQSETNNPPKFSQILKNCNKLIAKNIASAGSRTRISYIPCERPEPLDYRDLSNTLRNNRYI